MSLPDWPDANVQAAGPTLDQWADTYGLPRDIVYGLVSQESRFNPGAFLMDRNGGSYGLTQISLPTATGLGYGGDGNGLYDPDTNVKWGLLYLKQLVDRFGDMNVALSAYNGGYVNGAITNPSYVNGVVQRALYFDQLWSGDAMDPSGSGIVVTDNGIGGTFTPWLLAAGAVVAYFALREG